MHRCAILLVLFSAILHAVWNAQLKGSGNRVQFISNMSFAMGILALICIPFVPAPAQSSWGCIAMSSILHTCYNVLLLITYRKNDFSRAYPIARGIPPALVTLCSLMLMQQRPTAVVLVAVALISTGIIFLSTEKIGEEKYAKLFAVMTGLSIVAYTTVDSIGVQRSHNTISYTAWIFTSYLLLPAGLFLRGSTHMVRSPKRTLSAIAAAVFSLTAYALVLWATRYANVGIVSALRGTSVPWAVILGHVLLGEAFSLRRLISVLLICLGIVLLVAT